MRAWPAEARSRPAAGAARPGGLGPAPTGKAKSRGLQGDERAVSEVVGFMLIFGIIALIMILGMVAFNEASSDAHDRVAGLHGQGGADRVASMVVQAALFAEAHGTDARFSYRIDLPDQLEGEDYTIRLDPVGKTVVAEAAGTTLTAQLFQAGGGGVDLCDATDDSDEEVDGGPLYVRYGDPETEPEPALRFDVATTPCIYLETAQ